MRLPVGAPMREDMFKVIVERPRRTRGKPMRTKVRYVRGDRSRISGRRIATELGDRKWLNENLAPLKRYLRKQCGRKWDDVFSEICASLDTGSTVKMHVREHLQDFVMIKVRVDERGRYWGTGHWSEPSAPNSWWPDLYVCPHDGRIKETRALLETLNLESARDKFRRKQRRKRSLGDSFRRLSDTEYLVLCEGIWYRFVVSVPPTTPQGYSYGDYALRNDLRNYKTIARVNWALISKTQLSSKALKTYGLRNGDPNG